MNKLQEKFNNLILENIPARDASLRFEIETIQEETEDFTNQDALDMGYEKNFNYLYFVIEKKYPNALKSFVEAERVRVEEEVRLKAIQEEADRKRIEEEVRLKKEEEEKNRVAEEAKAKADKIAAAKAIADKFKKKSEPAATE